MNYAAFAAAGAEKDLVKNTQIDKIDEMRDVTRGMVLKVLLAKIPSDGGKGAPTYILRRDCIEITTVGARMLETERPRMWGRTTTPWLCPFCPPSPTLPSRTLPWRTP